MEIVIMVIMAMAGLAFVIKLTFHNWVGRALMGLIAAVFIIATYDMASTQSKTQISDWLSQPDLMLDTAVWLTVDVAFQIGFCMLIAKSIGGKLSKSERMIMTLCLWIPGLLIFPVLFAILTELIFTFTGVPFATVAWIVGAGLAVAIPLAAALFKWLIPERDIRIEMIFMVNLIVVALGVVATVNGRTAAVGTDEIDWPALAGVSAIIISGLCIGLAYRKYMTRKKISRLQ